MPVARTVPKIIVVNWLETGVEIRRIKFSNQKNLCWNFRRQNRFLLESSPESCRIFRRKARLAKNALDKNWIKAQIFFGK